MLKVGFYAGGIDLRSGGIAPYAQRVIRALANFHFTSAVDLSVVGAASLLDPTVRVPLMRIPSRLKGSRITQARHNAADAFTVLCGGKPRRRDREYYLGNFLNGLGLDLLHVPYQVPPTYDLTIPFIVTMHDVQEIHFPEFFTAEERRDRATRHLQSIRRAAAVVVSFDHVKRDLVRYFGCDDEHVVVVPLPLEQCVLREPSETETSAFERRYKPYRNFFLYPAQTWEHKNHIRLIQAFELVCRRADLPLSMICTGRRSEYFSQIEAHLRGSSVSDRVVFTDIVSEAELSWLYQECLGVVIPALYEAGSFPLIEAMQLGAATICAQTTSLPETIGDPQFLFDPKDVEAIAAAMMKLAIDSEYRSASVENSCRRAGEMKAQIVGAHYEELWHRVARAGDIQRHRNDR